MSVQTKLVFSFGFGTATITEYITNQIREVKKGEASQGRRSAVLCHVETAICVTALCAAVASRELLYLLTLQVWFIGLSPDRRRTTTAFHNWVGLHLIEFSAAREPQRSRNITQINENTLSSQRVRYVFCYCSGLEIGLLWTEMAFLWDLLID